MKTGKLGPHPNNITANYHNKYNRKLIVRSLFHANQIINHPEIKFGDNMGLLHPSTRDDRGKVTIFNGYIILQELYYNRDL